MVNTNVIPTFLEDGELSILLDMAINPCPYCKLELEVTSGLWVFGEKVLNDEEWMDIISFGCPKCEASGPACGSRGAAILAWNVFVQR